MDPASRAEMNVFGEGAKAHPVTGMALEQGIGALSEQEQAHMHCDVIEHHHGKHHADIMRARVKTFYQIVADEAAAIAAHVPMPHHTEE